MSKYFDTLVLFQTFGHGVLIIVHVSIGGFVTDMRDAVFHHEASSWYCSVLIELYIVGL